MLPCVAVSPNVHPRGAARVAILLATASSLGACFDWTTRVSPPSDGGVSRDATLADDRDVPDATESDAAPPIEGGPSCTDLVADVVASRAKARRCTLGAGHCVAKVKDECDCEHFVGTSDSPETVTFEAKIALARASGCRDHCGSCAFLPSQGTCLTQGGTNSCSP